MKMHDLQMLFSELKAIERWDDDYYRNGVHDTGARIAYNLRQRRRQEIVEEIAKWYCSPTLLLRKGEPGGSHE